MRRVHTTKTDETGTTDRADPFVKKLGGSGEVDTCGEETRGLRGDVSKL
jgi:hypothetical protein